MKKIITILALFSVLLSITSCDNVKTELKNEIVFGDEQNINAKSDQDIDKVENSNANQELPTPTKTTDNSLMQANFTNWGLIINNGEDIYYSDYSTGIYKYKDSQTEEMFIAGIYSDMALLDNIIYCLEQIEYDDIYYRTEVVGINLEDGNKQVFYTLPDDENYMYGLNIINDKYYFVISDELLFSIDKNGTVENQRIYYPKQITPYGIYTSDALQYGLTLMSFEGQIIKTYPTLSEYEPYVLFELDNYIYLKDDPDDDNNRIYRFNKETEELSVFPNEEFFEDKCYNSTINYFNGKFYILITTRNKNGDVSHNIYSTDLNGNSVEKIYSSSNTSGISFCTLNIANGYLLINYLFTTLDPEIIDLNNVVKKTDNFGEQDVDKGNYATNIEEFPDYSITYEDNNSSPYTANNTEYFIGGTGPLTGSASSYGISVKEGATLAIEEINANGGLNGVKFKLDIKDDQAARYEASAAYDQLFEAGMQISLGSVTSGSCEAFATKADADDMFYITPSASAEYCIEPDNGFRICFGDTDQGVLAAKELAAKHENIGVIYDASDIYSTLIYEAFEDEMANLGKEYLVQTFDAEKRTDFSTQVEALKGCDVIFLPIYYTEASLVTKACVNEGCDALIFGCDGFDGIADQVDETVINTIQYITPFDVNSTDENVKSFVDAYTAKYNKVPDQFAAGGYDAVMVIYEAMKKAGINDVTIDPATLCEKLIGVITAEDFVYVGATGTMTWDVSGTCIKVPTIIELKK